jgi:hypothetical protein
VQSRLFGYNEGWDVVEGYAPRLLSSVILQPGEKEYLMQDVERFRKSKQRYERLSLPSWLSVLRTSGDGQDVRGICLGGKFRTLDLFDQSR